MRGLRERLRALRAHGVARDTGFAAALDALQLLVMLLSFTLLGKQLGPTVFGAYAALYALVGILGGFVYSGPGLAVVQSLVRDGLDLRRAVASYLGLVLGLGVLASGVGLLVATLTVPSLGPAVLLSFLLAELVAFAGIELLASVVYAREGVAVAARYRVLPLLTKLVVLLGLAGTGQLTIGHLGLAYLVVYPLLLVGVAVSVGRRYGQRLRPGRPERVHLRSSVLYATTVSAVSLQNDGDKIVLSASRSGADTGLYAAAYRLVLMGMVPLRALLSASHRHFLEHDAAARGQHVTRALRFSMLGFGYGVVFFAALWTAAPLVTVLLGDAYDGAVPMLRALAGVVAVRSLAEFGLNGLLGFGRVGLRTAVTVAASATALVLYVVLVPRYGWQGAVVGTYASEVVLGVLAWVALVRLQRRHDAALQTPVDGVPPASRASVA